MGTVGSLYQFLQFAEHAFRVEQARAERCFDRWHWFRVNGDTDRGGRATTSKLVEQQPYLVRFLYEQRILRNDWTLTLLGFQCDWMSCLRTRVGWSSIKVEKLNCISSKKRFETNQIWYVNCNFTYYTSDFLSTSIDTTLRRSKHEVAFTLTLLVSGKSILKNYFSFRVWEISLKLFQGRVDELLARRKRSRYFENCGKK